MAIQNNDYLVLQQRASGLIHKTTVQNLLDQVPASVENIGDLDDVSDTAATDGQVLVWDTDEWKPQDPSALAETPNLQAVTTKGNTTDKAIVALSFSAGGMVQGAEVQAGTADNAIRLNGSTGEIGGGANVYIDCGEYAT